MLTVLHAFSLEPPASEVEFLRRELGIQWQQVSESELESRIANQRRTLVIMSEPEPYWSVVEQAPIDSIVCLMISDEAYSRERIAIARPPSIHHVYRHYPVQPASWGRIAGSAAGYVRDSRGTSQRASTIVPNVRSGMRVRSRMKHWQAVEHKVSPIPLGYTDTFARAFAQRFDLSTDASVFSVHPTNATDRDRSVAFRGNRGLAQRIVGSERAMKVTNSEVALIDADWSARAAGDVGATYVDSLVSARFALCPPGFANNESFRYYEALACGALPIEVSVASTHLGELPWRNNGSIAHTSWTRGLREAEEMPEDERERRVLAARGLITDVLHTSSMRMRADVEGA